MLFRSSLIILELHDTARGPAVADAWYQVRKKIGDIRGTLPEGVVGNEMRVKAGLQSGQLVVTAGANLLEDGQKVRLP